MGWVARCVLNHMPVTDGCPVAGGTRCQVARCQKVSTRLPQVCYLPVPTAVHSGSCTCGWLCNRAMEVPDGAEVGEQL